MAHKLLDVINAFGWVSEHQLEQQTRTGAPAGLGPEIEPLHRAKALEILFCLLTRKEKLSKLASQQPRDMARKLKEIRNKPAPRQVWGLNLNYTSLAKKHSSREISIKTGPEQGKCLYPDSYKC